MKVYKCPGVLVNSYTFCGHSTVTALCYIQSNDPEALQAAESVKEDLIMFIRLLIKARKCIEAIERDFKQSVSSHSSTVNQKPN